MGSLRSLPLQIGGEQRIIDGDGGEELQQREFPWGEGSARKPSLKIEDTSDVAAPHDGRAEDRFRPNGGKVRVYGEHRLSGCIIEDELLTRAQHIVCDRQREPCRRRGALALRDLDAHTVMA